MSPVQSWSPAPNAKCPHMGALCIDMEMTRIEIAELLAGSHPFGQPGGLFKGISGVPAIRACLSFAAGDAKESWSPAPMHGAPIRGPHLSDRCLPRCGGATAHLMGRVAAVPTAKAPELLLQPPSIETDNLAAKLP